MSYPERGAGYRNKPAWMDRAMEGEKRAQGGPIQIGNHAVGNGAGVADIADAATDDAKDDLAENMRSKARTSGWERGEYKSKGPTKGNLESRDMMDKALGKDEAEKFRQENGNYAKGGRVRRRADGGDVGETFTEERDRLGQDEMNKLPPRSGSGFVEERDQLGQDAMSKLPPRAYKRRDDTKDKIGKGMGQTLGWKSGGAV